MHVHHLDIENGVGSASNPYPTYPGDTPYPERDYAITDGDTHAASIWLAAIDLPEVRRRAFRALKDAKLQPDQPVKNIRSAIERAFTWENTIEGDDYWYDMAMHCDDPANHGMPQPPCP